MSEVEWGKLARWQDQLARTEDMRQRQRRQNQRQLYKNDLEKMIEQKRKNSRTIQQKQKQFYRQLYSGSVNVVLSKNSNYQISPSQQKFDMMLKQSAKYNLNTGKQRRQRVKSQINQEKIKLNEKYKKVQTEMSEEKMRTVEQREMRKKNLASYYQEQIHSTQSKKYMERLENQKFQQIAHQLQLKKERQRQNHIHKIRYGYHQNPQAYDIIKQIYKHREEEKGGFLDKMQNSRIQDNSEQIKKHKKHLQTIQTSRFNKNYFVNKQIKKKQMQQKQLQEQHLKIQKLQRQLLEQVQRNKIKKENQRKMLKTQLEHQIQEEGDMRMKWKRMSQNQTKINKEYFNHQGRALLPGITKDYKDQKREYILENFLKNPRSTPNTLQTLQSQSQQY